MFRASLAFLVVLFLSPSAHALLYFDLNGYLENGIEGTVEMFGKVTIDDQAQSAGPGSLGGTSYSAPITAFEIAFGGHNIYGDVVFTGSGGKLDIFNNLENQGDCVWIHDLNGTFAGTYQGLGRASLIFTMKNVGDLWDDESLGNVAQLGSTRLKDVELTTAEGQRMVARIQAVTPVADEISAESPLSEAPVPEPASMALTGLGLAGWAAWRRRRAS